MSTWKRAAWRWCTIAALLGALSFLYGGHPIYAGAAFAPWRPVFHAGVIAWLVFGLPYSWLTLRRFSSRANDLREPAIHFMLLARALFHGRFRRTLRDRRVTTSLRALAVKAFYLPLVTSFLAGHVQSLARAWALRKDLPVFAGATLAAWISYVRDVVPRLAPTAGDLGAIAHASWYTLPNLRFAADAYYDLVFIVDCGVALVGYGLESRWLGNKTRSVDATALGWAAALFCYPPFNDVLGTYLPLGGHRAWMSPTAQLGCRLLSLAAFTVYAWATLSFGLKFSNLTNRGIIERGPYRFVRHPAYVAKSLAWWLESLPSLTLSTAVFLSLLNAVYALRAWTEERHLSRDPDYRAYKERVRWSIVPHVI